MGNITDIANVSGSPYIVEREKGVITVNTNNVEIDEQTEISFYISARIYIIFSSRKYKIN